MFAAKGYEFDYVYDWNIIDKKKKRESMIKQRELSRGKIRDVSPNIRKLNLEQTGG